MYKATNIKVCLVPAFEVERWEAVHVCVRVIETDVGGRGTANLCLSTFCEFYPELLMTFYPDKYGRTSNSNINALQNLVKTA